MFKIRQVIFLLCILILVLARSSFAASFKQLDPDGVVFKAGPTEPSEELSIPWVEAVLYPKNVEAGKEFFVEVSLAAPVESVSAAVDQEKSCQLHTQDKNNWNAVVVSSDKMEEGLHFLKISISGKNGRKIDRTLVFHVIGNALSSREKYAYPVALKNDFGRFKAGEKVEALFKQSYYWVKGPDGHEGWVEASNIEASKREIYVDAYNAYMNQEYDKAIAYYKKVAMLDPVNADVNYWLAKSYNKIGDEENTVESLKTALMFDPSHKGANILAAKLGQDYFKKANILSGMGRNKEAIINFEQAVALRPGSISYRLGLGRAYQKDGSEEKAQEAWKQVLLIDPDNKSVHSLLHTDYSKLLAREEEAVVQDTKRSVSEAKPAAKPNKLAANYVDIVKKSRTDKGTLVSSAVQSVVSMTRSLGTRIYEDGWKTGFTTEGFLVTYACRQERLGKFEPESFVFRVDLDSRKVEPYNKNARLLMNRW